MCDDACQPDWKPLACFHTRQLLDGMNRREVFRLNRTPTGQHTETNQ
jgi:hypothetical protein